MDAGEPVDAGGAAGDGGEIPVAKPAGAAGSAPSGPRPIFELEEDRCPRCGEVMAPDAVVCVKCGYDLRANVVREVETGTVEAPVAASAEAVGAPADAGADAAGPAFVVPTRLTVKALVIGGAVLTAAALVTTLVWGGRKGFVANAALAVYLLYTVAVNTATGVAAVGAAAKLRPQRFGSVELAGARMLVASALFEALYHVRLPLGYAVFSSGVPFVLACAAYFGVVMLLFRKDRATTMLVAGAHFVMWVLVQVGPVLAGVARMGVQEGK